MCWLVVRYVLKVFLIARREEKIFLGEHPDDVTMESVRINLDAGFQPIVPTTRASTTRGRTATAETGQARNWSASPDYNPVNRATTSMSGLSSVSHTASPTGAERKSNALKPKTAREKKTDSLFVLPGLLVDGRSSSPRLDSNNGIAAETAEIDVNCLFGVPAATSWSPNNSPKSRRARAKTTGPGDRRDGGSNDHRALNSSSNDLSKSMSSVSLVPAKPWNGNSPVKLIPLNATAPAAMSELLAASAQQHGSTLSKKSEKILSRNFSKRPPSQQLPGQANTYFSSSLQTASLVSNLTDNSGADEFPQALSSIDMNTLEALFQDSDIDGGSYIVADKLKKESRLNISALTGSLSQLNELATKKVKISAPALAESKKTIIKPVKSAKVILNSDKNMVGGVGGTNNKLLKPGRNMFSLQQNLNSVRNISNGGFLFPGLLSTTKISDHGANDASPPGTITDVDIAPVPLAPALFL
jgi:hypothetical protein